MLNVFRFNRKKNNQTEKAEIDADTLLMIENIKELKDTTAKEIMIPRIDVVSIKLKTSLRELVNSFKECGYSRLPVFNKTVDDIAGIIYVKDLFNLIIQGIDLNESHLEMNMLKKAYFIPETKKINVLLKEFQSKKIHLAIVVDEYGGFSGIVSLENILEEIVGEIQDEYDQEEAEIIKIHENQFNCDARTDIEEINEELKINLPTDNVDTLGGFLYELIGRIPNKNEKFLYENIDFEVVSINKNIIDRILITINDKNSGDDSGET